MKAHEIIELIFACAVATVLVAPVIGAIFTERSLTQPAIEALNVITGAIVGYLLGKGGRT